MEEIKKSQVTEKSGAKKYLICGYYGYKNSGDEALLASVIEDIKEVNSENSIVILSKEDAVYDFSGVRAIDRFDFRRVRRAIKSCDILVMGGGSLLQDKTSNKSLYYYLLVIFWGNYFGKQTYLYSNGLGPISSSFNRWLSKKVLNRVSEICFRDEDSYALAREIGVVNTNMRVGADSVFSLRYEVEDNYKEDRICFVIRKWEDSESFLENLAKYADYIQEAYGYDIIFVPLKIPDDKTLSERLQSKMEHESKIVILDDVASLVSFFAASKLVVSMRFHGLVYSSIGGTPSIGLSYDEKVTSICEDLDIPYQSIKHMDVDGLKKISKDIFEHYDESREVLDKAVKELREKAKINKEILYKL